MARVLVVDDEALTRTMVADIVRSCGHDAETAASGEEGLAAFRQGRFDLVLTDITMPGMDGIDLGKAIVKWAPGTPVVLVSSNDELGVFEDSARRGFQPTGFARKPLERAELTKTIRRHVTASRTSQPSMPPPGTGPTTLQRLAGSREDDSELSWLTWAGGSAAVLGPMRLLFVAARQRATGQLKLTGPGGSVCVGVKGGDVVAIEGIPGLFRSLQLPTEVADLQTGLQVGIGQGLSLDTCLAAAAHGLGQWLCAIEDDPVGEVRWDAGWSPPHGAIALPGNVPRWCGGVIATKSLARLEGTWARRSRMPLQRRIPGDSVESAWGLDPLSLRVHRLASSPRTLRSLLDEVANGDDARRIAGLRSIDLLNSLGLLQGDDYLAPDMTTQEVPKLDPRIATLREASQQLLGKSPLEVLDLADKHEVTEQDVVRAFREISRTYHPDTFFGAPPAVRSLAEDCFAIVNAAYDQLRAPGAIAQLKQKQAAAAGAAPAPEPDPAAARLAFKRGEVLWRAREYKAADPHYDLAAQLDPKTWPYVLMAAQSGYYAKRLTVTDAVKRLDGLLVTDRVREGEIQATAGNLLKLDGKLQEAADRYQRALARDPANRDALRENRLNATRTPVAAPSLSSQIQSLFKRKPAS